MPQSNDLPQWVYLTPGPVGTIYCAVIGGICSPPFSSAIDAIDWGQRQLDAMHAGLVCISEATVKAAWGERVAAAMERAA